MSAETGIREIELRAGLQRKGERIQSYIVVARTEGGERRFVVYLRVSWRTGYHRLLFNSQMGDEIRRFRSLDAVHQFAARYGYLGVVSVYRAGDPELARFRGVLACDGGTTGPGVGRPGLPRRKSSPPSHDGEVPSSGSSSAKPTDEAE